LKNVGAVGVKISAFLLT